MIKITTDILSIPHYISTTWANIASLQVVYENNAPVLIIEQFRGNQVQIPGLSWKAVESIFSGHADALTRPSKGSQPALPPNFGQPLDLGPLSFNIPAHLLINNMDQMGMFLQHNPEGAHLPNLPEEILGKITSMVKTLGLGEETPLPQPEEGCNCAFCQVSKAIHSAVHKDNNTAPKESSSPEVHEELVNDVDLTFRNWNIHEIGDKLYEVSNPLDLDEKYNVHLGTPLGCTCGMPGCEHIKAVLHS